MATTASPLKPYIRERAGRRIRPLSLAFMVAYSVATGAGVALLPAELLFILAVPILIAVPVILWLMPDGDFIPEATVATLLISFIVANAFWPNYLSIDLPGLPWINPARVVVFGLLAIVLYSFSSSSRMRSETAASLAALPWVRNAFWLFLLMTFVTLPLSNQPVFSLNKWANNQIFWTFMFVLSAWLATRDGTITRIARVVVFTAIVVALETIYEFSIRQVPWMNHIPSFLRVDEAYLINVLKSQARAGTEIYRARGTFSVSLICAEYLAITYPFIIHALLTARTNFARIALFLGLVAVLAAIWFTNARSGMIGFFMSVFLYGGFAALRYWRRNRQSLVGATTLAMMPVLAAVFLVLALTWPRLHNMTIGGAQHQPSSEARSAQWSMGMPKVWKNPIGHGTARAGNTLSYANRGGQLTIDTYYLTLLLEYGVVGFAAFLAMFGGQAFYGIRLYFAASAGEEDFAGPITIALLNFLVIKSVLSSEFNMPLAFIFLGMLTAIAWRQQQRLRGVVPVRPAGARNAELRGGALAPA